MSGSKRPAESAAAGEGSSTSETPAKRARFSDSATADAAPAGSEPAKTDGAAEVQAQSSSNNDGAKGENVETANSAKARLSSPGSQLTPSELDSPSVARAAEHRGGGRGGRGGGRGGQRGAQRGGRGGRGGNNIDRGGKRGRGSNRGSGSTRADSWNTSKRGENDSAGQSTPTQEGKRADGEQTARLPKRKVALLVGYDGNGYSGSQINFDVRTIEGELWNALIKAETISEDNRDSVAKVGLSRAARTDAGVHAAINVFAIKLILQPPSLEPGKSLVEHINSFLPDQIRLWRIIRVQGSFQPRQSCDFRHYEYLLPTHVLLGPNPSSHMGQRVFKAWDAYLANNQSASASADGATSELPPALAEARKFFEENSDKLSDYPALLKAKRSWRCPAALLESLRSFMRVYEGSHNFWNFTIGRTFRDRSCQRQMREIKVSDAFLVEGVEYVAVSIRGQSFMLHQIRKMIGLAVIAVRTATPVSLVPETYGPSRVHVPKAPALGLLLVQPMFVEYNRRVAEANKRLGEQTSNGRISEQEANDQTRDALDMDEEARAKVDAFKKEAVYKRMWETEREEGIFSKWLNYLDVFPETDFDFLNPKGVIPESAVAKAEGGMTSASKSNKGQTRAAEKGEQAADATEGKVDDGNLTDNEDDELLRSGKLNEELEG